MIPNRRVVCVGISSRVGAVIRHPLRDKSPDETITDEEEEENDGDPETERDDQEDDANDDALQNPPVRSAEDTSRLHPA